MIPIPNSQVILLNNSTNSNFSLFFTRMTKWKDDGTKDRDAIITLKTNGDHVFTSSTECLKNVHKKQVKVLSFINDNKGLFIEIKAKLISKYVSGLGSGHPTETGMVLDRNTGLPYIPASSIKGVLRNACDMGVVVSDKYFGKTEASDSARGQLILLDAYPAKIPQLKMDIINPHGFEETKNPLPIKFISVNEGTEFIFRAFMMPLDGSSRDSRDTKDKNIVLKLFNQALSQMGLGAKTSVGYGMFDTVSDNSVELNDTFNKIRAEKENEIEKNRIKNMSPEEKTMMEVSRLNIVNAGEVIAKILGEKHSKNIYECAIKKLKEIGIKSNTSPKWKTKFEELQKKISE